MPTTLTIDIDVLKVFTVRPNVELQHGDICTALGLPASFKGQKSVKGQQANSDGGNMSIADACERLLKRGFLKRRRKGNAWIWQLESDYLDRLLTTYDRANGEKR